MARTKTNAANAAGIEVISQELVNFNGEYDVEREDIFGYAVKDVGALPKEIRKELEKFPEGGDKSITVQRYEANLLADAYDSIQKQRIAVGNRISAIKRGTDEGTVGSNSALLWYYSNLVSMEKSLTKAIDAYTHSSKTGLWLLEIMGIGPVKSAKLMAYFDVTKCAHYNQFHSYAGLNDNNRPWLGKEKSEKIIRNILDNRSEVLDTLNTLIEDNGSLSGKDIKEVANNYPNDDQPKVQIIRKIIDDKKLVTKDKVFIVKTILESDGLPKSLSTIDGHEVKVPRTRKPAEVASNYQLMLISNETKWSLEYLNKNARDDKGKITLDKLKSACAKVPYNRDLKKLCYLIGDGFVKVSNKPKSLYGRLYRERKAYELAKNERGEYAEEAAKALASKNWSDKKTKQIYESGKLPLGHIENRARRYAVKIFIAHLFEAMYYFEYGELAPDPYPLEYMGHVDYIEPEVDFTKF